MKFLTPATMLYGTSSWHWRQTTHYATKTAILLPLAAPVGKDVSRLWDMASGKGHSLDRMSKPTTDEHDSSSWKRVGESTLHSQQRASPSLLHSRDFSSHVVKSTPSLCIVWLSHTVSPAGVRWTCVL